MNPNDEPPIQKSGHSCLIALALTAVVIAVSVALINSDLKEGVRHFERKKAERRTESFEKVKAGDDGNGIIVFQDPRLIEMLAGDDDCIKNLKRLNLSSVDLNGPQTASAGKLVNVNKIAFYDCVGPEELLKAMKGSPSVEELSFDTTLVSDDGVRMLATFPNLKKVYFSYVNEQSREKLLRETLPGVEIEIEELGKGPEALDAR